jgi:hypothetical protein
MSTRNLYKKKKKKTLGVKCGRRVGHKYKETYYKRTSGKHVKTEPKKEKWERLNKNGALDFYI